MKDEFCAVEFDEDATPLILDLFEKEINEEGKVIDKTLNEVEVDQYSQEELTKETFGGVLVGSKVFVSKNHASFAEHINLFCKK